jgi:hypothetical protein
MEKCIFAGELIGGVLIAWWTVGKAYEHFKNVCPALPIGLVVVNEALAIVAKNSEIGAMLGILIGAGVRVVYEECKKPMGKNKN